MLAHATDTPIRLGGTIAELLHQSWRSEVSRAPLTDEQILAIAPLVLQSGAAPLASRRAPGHHEFQQAYRLSKLRSVIRAEHAFAVYDFFRSRGIEALIVKGWAAARLYPDPALRPYADVDVCVSRDDFASAAKAIAEQRPIDGAIDLHQPPSHRALQGRSLHQRGDDFEELADHAWPDVMARSVLVPAAGGVIRVPSPEDHLRIAALHCLKHAGFRPTWLCDIAVAVENRGRDFRWDLAYGGDAWRSRCVRAALLVARDLLGADLNGVPGIEGARAPAWMASAIMAEWERPDRWPGGRPRIGTTLVERPATLFREAARRWPGPLESTINLRGPINDFPRFPLQFAQLVLRLPVIPRQLTSEIRRRLASRKS